MSPRHRDEWSLGPDAFDRLLDRLGENREEAARAYEALRHRLIDFFDWRGATSPEALADETLDRVARKLQQGAGVENVAAYARGIARNVLHETFRRRTREHEAMDALAAVTPTSAPPPAGDAVDSNARLSCLRECLGALPADSRSLVLAYYGEARVHLAGRKALAAGLHMSYSNLRQRVHRLRVALADCLQKCLAEAVVVTE
jgi:DNA-directed RNA polymerase specialized sigma24 family protein